MRPEDKAVKHLDVAGYIGLPFREKGRDRQGLDCWGLLRMIYRERLAVDLPCYTEEYLSTRERDEIARLCGQEKTRWDEVPRGQERPGDAVLLNILGRPVHVGVVVEPGRFIHVMDGLETCLETYASPKWERRVAGFFRLRPEAGNPTVPQAASGPAGTNDVDRE
jgi:cell wall-associated NlpC family hydrolase